MIVFIDESGDPGFKIEKGSSVVFVIAMVIFDDYLIAEEVSLTVKKLRREFKFSDDTEFKFHKSRFMIRRKFLTEITKYRFRIRAIVVKKDTLYSNFLRTRKESFFNYVVMQVLKHSGSHLEKAKLKFDKRGEKRMRNELRAYLSRELDNKNKHIFNDLKFVDSRQNVLIQVADMVAGCISSFHSGTDRGLHEIIKKRIEDEWIFK